MAETEASDFPQSSSHVQPYVHKNETAVGWPLISPAILSASA
jgi:hypothetical protein